MLNPKSEMQCITTAAAQLTSSLFSLDPDLLAFGSHLIFTTCSTQHHLILLSKELLASTWKHLGSLCPYSFTAAPQSKGKKGKIAKERSWLQTTRNHSLFVKSYVSFESNWKIFWKGTLSCAMHVLIVRVHACSNFNKLACLSTNHKQIRSDWRASPNFSLVK